MWKNKTEPLSYTTNKKVAQNGLKVLNAKLETFKTPLAMIWAKIFLDMTSKSISNKRKKQ